MAFRFTVPVRFADVDHAGIVYYPVFFHYFHQAFEELFRERLGARGFVDLIDVDKVGLPAVHLEADFRAPLAFGDDVEVAVSLREMGERSYTLHYEARKVGASEVAATADITCAVIDLAAFRARPIPELLRNIFESL